MSAILIPILIVAGVGLIAGVGLAIASALMAVPVNEQEQAVLEVLPGANCGACGFSGCSGYAAALAAGEAENGLCAPGGAAVSQEIASVLGIAAADVERKTAVVHCLGTYDNTSDKLEYQGVNSCAAAMQLYGGLASCAFGCIGLGDCASVCDYGAISTCNGVASVNRQLCVGCSKCVRTCPKGIISLEKYGTTAVYCSSRVKGGETRKVCKAGCIGCMKCTKVCPTGAITVTDFCASVDSSKCNGCGACLDVCPANIVKLR